LSGNRKLLCYIEGTSGAFPSYLAVDPSADVAGSLECSTMRTPNEFWLCLHELSTAKDAEGTTIAERQANIVNSFRKMPPLARQQSLDELIDMEIALQDLFPLLLGQKDVEGRELSHDQKLA
jgi:hypothetical protein